MSQQLKIPEDVERQLMQKKLQEIQSEAEKIKDSLRDEISKGLVSVETEGLKIIIRIHEKGSFPSGSAVLKAGFEPVMQKITESVIAAKGKVVVAGHTDDIPISTEWYRSNWELASSRAVTVAHYMLENKRMDPERLIIEGYADTKPLVPNTSAENRAKNRRVEIILEQNSNPGGEKVQIMNVGDDKSSPVAQESSGNGD